MASIPTYDEFHATPGALPAARQESLATPGLMSGPAQAIERAGASMQSAGADFLHVQTQMQERQNADMIFRSETALKTDYLAFEQMARNRRGQDAWGLAKDTADWWDKKTSEHADALENPRQQQLFKQQAAKLRIQSLDTMSAYESEQRRASLVESANASVTSSINLAAANAQAWKPPAFVVGNPEGMTEQGNIDLVHRPIAKNGDDSISTVRSMSVNIDGQEVLIPTVVNGKVVSDEAAIQHYRDTGEHLGKFDSPSAADAYAEALHKQQDSMYGRGVPPDPIQQAKSDVMNRVAVVAGINGWTADIIKEKQAEALTNLHTQVIQNLANENPTQAKAYYEANKNEINGSARDPLEKTLKIAGIKSTAQKAADAVMAMEMPEAEALATIRKQYDGEEEAAAVLEVKTRYEERSKMREASQRTAADQAWDVYAKTGRLNAIPSTVLNAMDGKDVIALRDRAEKDAEGKPIKTDFAVYYDLSRQAMDNPAAFQKVDLRRYSAVIGEADLKQLAGMQKTISQDAGKGVAEIGTQLSVAHNRLGWGEGDRDKKGAFDNAVLNTLDAQRTATGKEPTYKERQEVIDRMMIDGKLNGTGFFGTNVFADKGKVYEFSDRSDFKKFVADIPADERKKIEGALIRNNQAVTDKAVADLYARKNKLPRPDPTPGPGTAPAITPPKPVATDEAWSRYQNASDSYHAASDAYLKALSDPDVKPATIERLRKESDRLQKLTDKAHEEWKNGR